MAIMQSAEVPSDAIAELEVGVRWDDGSTEPLTVRLLRPVPSAQLECWQCEYQLAGYRTAGRPI